MLYKLIKNLGLVAITQAIIGLSGFLLVVLITRKFGIESNGMLYVIKRGVDFLWVPLLIGLTVSVPRNKPFLDKKDKGSVEFILLLSVPLLAAISFIIGPFMSKMMLGQWSAEYKWLFVILVVSNILQGISYAYFRASMKYNHANVIQLIGFVFVPLVTVWFSGNILEYVTMYSYLFLSVSGLIWLYISSVYLLPEIRKNFANVKKTFAGNTVFLFRYGFNRLPGLIGASVIYTFPALLMNRFASQADVGVFSFIMQFISILSLPINSLGIVLLPHLSARLANQDHAGAQKIVAAILSLFGRAGAVCSVFLLAFFHPILSLITNQEMNIAFLDWFLLGSGLMLVYYNLLRNPIDASSSKAYSTFVVIYSLLSGLGTAAVCLTFLSYMATIKLSIFASFLSMGILSQYFCVKLYRIKIDPNNLMRLIAFYLFVLVGAILISYNYGLMLCLLFIGIMAGVWIFVDAEVKKIFLLVKSFGQNKRLLIK
ncbi:hypothetical protein DQG23_10340 [Paenibacillus contaminans]|uniref:Polysaccharide biosynthesis protein C-terminal domain-containing protein n=1 Tax=Paenibacillus contaminans TaxID=450362 RepID=A0A329MSH9_9BACL|nr:hypothetical protein DQG23_10340 [Paenibacillus contaminans]